MRILFFILVIFTFFVHTAKGTDTFAIKLNNNAPVQYCTTPELIAKDLTIDGTFTISGMKVSFSEGYRPGEDELVYAGAIGNIVATWYSGQGYLLLKGDGNTTNENYRDAIKLVRFKNNSPIPTIGVRKISITLEDADYLPETGHFYRFVEKSNMTWSAAKAEAESLKYYDLKGYLATITSTGENDFIKLKTRGVGWIGASDAGIEGQWRWVTGPEGLEENTKGRLFYVTGSGPVAGEYTNWNSGEPNNVNGGENYAHITVFPTNPANSYKWNDLPDSGGSGDYVSRGYLIEFGGFPGEPEMSLSATLVLQVNTMLFNTGTVPAICEGKSYMLNMADLNAIPATYAWTPAESLSSATEANPYATPAITTTYKVTGNRGVCYNTATYTVPVNPKPVSLLNPAENICTGQSKTLDPGLTPGYTYLWNNGAVSQTITVNSDGVYSVTVTSDKACAETFQSEVTVHPYPTIDLNSLKTLICGEPKSTILNIPTNAVAYTLTSADGKAAINGLAVSVPVDGVYPLVYKAAIYPGCSVEKRFDLSFYKTPQVNFTVNDQKCYGYNLDAEYLGDADLVNARFTWSFGGEIIVDGLGRYKETIPLGVNQSNRNLVLKVEQNGCSAEHTLSDIRVIPTLSMSVTKPILCQPELFEFHAMNTETGVTYDWNFGDGNTGTGANPNHRYSLSGKYDVKVTVTTNQNCTNTALIKEMIFAAPIPDVAFSLSPDDCLATGENQVSYAGLIGTDKDTYTWNLDSFDASEKLNDPQGTRGPFLFVLRNKPMAILGLKVKTVYGCESAPVNITLKRKPDFSIQSDLLVGCVSFQPTLSGLMNVNDLVDKVDFSWDFGNGIRGSGSPVYPIYTEPGKSFNVTLTGKSSVTQCSNLVENIGFLRSYSKPTAKFSMDNKVVYNDKPDVKFTDLSLGASAWLWNFGEESTSSVQNPTYHFMKMGRQMVSLQVSNAEGCTDEVSDTVLVAFDRLFPPNGFSPNAPNEVDKVFLLNSEGITPEGYHFTVLSRWNDIVFEAKDEIKGWDGRNENGTFAPAGAYVWGT